MNTLRKQFNRLSVFGGALVLGMAALAVSAPRAMAQSNVQGEVVLPVEARFANTTLPAGTYKFNVQPVGISRNFDTGLAGTSQVLVQMVGLAKGAPIVSVVGTATKVAQPDGKLKNIRVDASGNTFQSMYLENLGVMLEFQEIKPKNAIRAEAPQTDHGTTIAKGNV